MTITHVAQATFNGGATVVGGGPSGDFTITELPALVAGDLVCVFVQWGSATGPIDFIPATITYDLTDATEIDRRDAIVTSQLARTTIAYGFAAGGQTSVHITGSDIGTRGAITAVVDVFRGFGGSVTIRDYAQLMSVGGSGNIPAVTPSAGEPTAIWAPFGLNPDYHPDTVSSGWTLGTELAGGYRQTVNSAYRIEASPSGSYSSTVTPAGGESWWMAYTVAFDGATPPPPPPDPEPGVVLDPTGADPVPIGPDIISWRVQRGASPEITGAATVGTATIVLKNSIEAGADEDDKYNPENSGATLVDYLRDGTAIHIAVNSDGRLAGTDPVGVFGGRTQDWTVIPLPGKDVAPTVEVTCEDALGWLGRTPVNFGFQAGRSQGELRAAILSAAGEASTDLDHEIMTMPLSSAEGNALSLLEDLNRANGTRHFIRPAASSADWYEYVTRNRQHGLSGVADYTLNQQDDHVTGMQGWRLSADTVINQQKATVTPVVFTPSTFTVWQPEAMPINVTADRPFEVWVEFDDYVKDPTVNSAYSGATPTITLTSFGTTAKLVITVASGTCTFTTLGIQGALARRAPSQSFVADDLPSQAPPRGVRAGQEISGEYVGTLAAARGIAQHVVWRYATPQTRPTITVENWLPEQYEVEIGDIIAYTSPQLGVSGVLFEVVGITHDGRLAAGTEMAPVVHHVSQFVLERCRVQSDPGWFVLDTSELDSTDILAY